MSDIENRATITRYIARVSYLGRDSLIVHDGLFSLGTSALYTYEA